MAVCLLYKIVNMHCVLFDTVLKIEREREIDKKLIYIYVHCSEPVYLN